VELIRSGAVEPQKILAITFTRKAAEEMKERLDRLCPAESGSITVTNFHRLCLKILKLNSQALFGQGGGGGRNRHFEVVKQSKQMELMQECYMLWQIEVQRRERLERRKRKVVGGGVVVQSQEGDSSLPSSGKIPDSQEGISALLAAEMEMDEDVEGESGGGGGGSGPSEEAMDEAKLRGVVKYLLAFVGRCKANLSVDTNERYNTHPSHFNHI